MKLKRERNKTTFMRLSLIISKLSCMILEIPQLDGVLSEAAHKAQSSST
jgi:hypothetical protein